MLKISGQNSQDPQGWCCWAENVAGLRKAHTQSSVRASAQAVVWKTTSHIKPVKAQCFLHHQAMRFRASILNCPRGFIKDNQMISLAQLLRRMNLSNCVDLEGWVAAGYCLWCPKHELTSRESDKGSQCCWIPTQNISLALRLPRSASLDCAGVGISGCSGCPAVFWQGGSRSMEHKPEERLWGLGGQQDPGEASQGRSLLALESPSEGESPPPWTQRNPRPKVRRSLEGQSRAWGQDWWPHSSCLAAPCKAMSCVTVQGDCAVLTCLFPLPSIGSFPWLIWFCTLVFSWAYELIFPSFLFFFSFPFFLFLFFPWQNLSSDYLKGCKGIWGVSLALLWFRLEIA